MSNPKDNKPNGADLHDIMAKIIKEHEGLLRALAASEKEDRERFEQGLDSKYGWPEEDENAED